MEDNEINEKMAETVSKVLAGILGDVEEVDGDNAILFDEPIYERADSIVANGLVYYQDGGVDVSIGDELFPLADYFSGKEGVGFINAILGRLKSKEYTTCINPLPFLR